MHILVVIMPELQHIFTFAFCPLYPVLHLPPRKSAYSWRFYKVAENCSNLSFYMVCPFSQVKARKAVHRFLMWDLRQEALPSSHSATLLGVHSKGITGSLTEVSPEAIKG